MGPSGAKTAVTRRRSSWAAPQSVSGTIRCRVRGDPRKSTSPFPRSTSLTRMRGSSVVVAPASANAHTAGYRHEVKSDRDAHRHSSTSSSSRGLLASEVRGGSSMSTVGSCDAAPMARRKWNNLRTEVRRRRCVATAGSAPDPSRAASHARTTAASIEDAALYLFVAAKASNLAQCST
jgi:hypothetical protein